MWMPSASPQHVPALTPLIGVHRCCDPRVLPGRWQRWLVPTPGAHGSSSCALLGPTVAGAVIGACFWISLCLSWFVLPPELAYSVLKSETVCAGKEALKAALPFPSRGPCSGTCLCGGSRLLPRAPLVVGVPYCSPSGRLCTASPNTPPEFGLQSLRCRSQPPPAPADTCQTGPCRAARLLSV